MTSLSLRQLKLPYASSVRTPLEKLTPGLWGRPYSSFSLSRPGTERKRSWRVEHCRKDVQKLFDCWKTRFFLIWWIDEELFEGITPAAEFAALWFAVEEIVVRRPKSRERIANRCKGLNCFISWNFWINCSYLDFRSVRVKNWRQVVHVPSIMIDHCLSGLFCKTICDTWSRVGKSLGLIDILGEEGGLIACDRLTRKTLASNWLRETHHRTPTAQRFWELSPRIGHPVAHDISF